MCCPLWFEWFLWFLTESLHSHLEHAQSSLAWMLIYFTTVWTRENCAIPVHFLSSLHNVPTRISLLLHLLTLGGADSLHPRGGRHQMLRDFKLRETECDMFQKLNCPNGHESAAPEPVLTPVSFDLCVCGMSLLHLSVWKINLNLCVQHADSSLTHKRFTGSLLRAQTSHYSSLTPYVTILFWSAYNWVIKKSLYKMPSCLHWLKSTTCIRYWTDA